MSDGQGLSRSSRAFDTGVMVLGGVGVLVVAVVAAVAWEPRLSWIALLAAAIVPVLTRFHLIVTSNSESVEISFDSAVLVFLLVYLDPLDAMVLWVVAGPVAALSVRKRWPIRLFNAALVVVCGGAMAGVHLLLDGGTPTSGRTALAVIVGCAVYVSVDLVLSWIGASLESRKPIGEMISANEVLVAVGVLFGVASLGYLAALLASTQSRWLLVLVLMPVLAVVVASRATRSSRSDQRRLQVLLDSARQRRDLDDAPRIIEVAVASAATLLETDDVTVRPDGPVSGEIGALLDTGEGRTRWLVGTLKTDREHARERDQQALEALAADTAESLARSRLIHELERLAGTDALTGLVNRSVFADEVGRAVAEGRVIGCPPAVLYLDLDAFKAVNDRFGHHVGDLLVCEVADQLRACVRPSDVVARLGGDEFAVLVEGLDDTDALRVLAQRILDRLGAERAVDGHALTVGVSVGLAVADAGTSADDLLRNADMAMYDAKSRRRPVPALYRPELRERSLDRAELEADLRRALDGDELRVDYQPILRLPDGRVHGLEALARWEHPTRGLLTAGAFIDVAEQSGLIGQLGEWVLRQVMQDAPTLVETAGMPITLCVNVSARQLADSSLSELVRSLVAADTSGARLVLELTESVVIGEDREVQRRLAQLVDAGAALAMDDFGVGYSSVGYLRWLPVEVLKLDRSLLMSVVDDPRARGLVEAVLLMGHALGLTVVAEGVEEPEQWTFLAERGCALAQGYLMARPMPLGSVLHWLSEKRRTPGLPGQRRSEASALPAGESGPQTA